MAVEVQMCKSFSRHSLAHPQSVSVGEIMIRQFWGFVKKLSRFSLPVARDSTVESGEAGRNYNLRFHI